MCDYRDEVDVSKLYASLSELAHSIKESGYRVWFWANGNVHQYLTATPCRSDFSIHAYYRSSEEGVKERIEGIDVECERRCVGTEVQSTVTIYNIEARANLYDVSRHYDLPEGTVTQWQMLTTVLEEMLQVIEENRDQIVAILCRRHTNGDESG